MPGSGGGGPGEVRLLSRGPRRVGEAEAGGEHRLGRPVEGHVVDGQTEQGAPGLPAAHRAAPPRRAAREVERGEDGHEPVGDGRRLVGCAGQPQRRHPG
ncbi:hypothetical protein [Streptomyces sp. BK340]|uniref:hypothetical protein n=1 Tax=Streptomyces sp. BK340 TaxID=2572903 RepID=UPI001648FDE2|nr:hypothetical protein [Streptomyces sp. BK340]